MAWIQLNPPKTVKWQIRFWCVFILLIYFGLRATYWEAQSIEEERGRAQWNLGLNIVHGFVQDQKSDNMEKKADRLEKLLEKSEMEKQESREFQSAKRAIDKRREKSFFKPLAGLINRAKINIGRTMSDSGPQFVSEFHKPAALGWYKEGNELLQSNCSAEVQRDFRHPIEDPIIMEFPTDHLNTAEEIVHFYQIEVRFLEKVQRGDLLCDK